MHQRSDIFTVRNIFTLLIVGILFIGLYSYHGLNHKLSASSSSLKSMQLQMEAADSQLRSAIKAKTACFKDVMQLRANTIEMKTKLTESETDLAKQKHEASSKSMKLTEEAAMLKEQVEKLQNEVTRLKEDDRSKILKKKDEEEEKEKKLKEMTAEHELIVSKLKDQVSDLQRDKVALKEKLDAALASRPKPEEAKKEHVAKNKIDEEVPRQVLPPDLRKRRERKLQRQASLEDSKLNAEDTFREKLEVPKKAKAFREAVNDKDAEKPLEAQKPVLKLPLAAKEEGRELPLKSRLSQNEKKADDSPKALKVAGEKHEQQVDMPLPREAAGFNKDSNQLPQPAGQDNEQALRINKPLSNDDEGRRM